MTLQSPSLTWVDKPAPAGVHRIRADQTLDVAIWDLLRGQGALWVSAFMEPARRDPLKMYACVGDDLNGLVEAVNPGAVRGIVGNRPAIIYPSVADTYLLAPFALPAGYSIYTVSSFVTTSDTLGLVGVGPVSGHTLSLYQSGTSIGYDHSSSDAANRVSAGSNARIDGSINVIWSSFKASNKFASLAGMNSAVARITAATTETWTLASYATTTLRLGMSNGGAFGATGFEFIVVPACLSVDDTARHSALVTALAAKYGMSAA